MEVVRHGGVFADVQWRWPARLTREVAANAPGGDDWREQKAKHTKSPHLLKIPAFPANLVSGDDCDNLLFQASHRQLPEKNNSAERFPRSDEECVEETEKRKGGSGSDWATVTLRAFGGARFHNCFPSSRLPAQSERSAAKIAVRRESGGEGKR